MLIEEQIEQLKRIAEAIIKQKKLAQLDWDAAWSGVYPEAPNGVEIEEEFSILLGKVSQILEMGISHEHYDSEEDRIRMVYLEVFLKSVNDSHFL